MRPISFCLFVSDACLSGHLFVFSAPLCVGGALAVADSFMVAPFRGTYPARLGKSTRNYAQRVKLAPQKKPPKK